MKLTFPRWLLPATILLALLTLAVAGSGRPDPMRDSAALPPPLYADDGVGVWSAARKRAARRNCAARFADPGERRRCLATIPNDGDWGARGR